MNIAKQIIDIFGGAPSVAGILNLDRTTVNRWTYEPPKGTGGRIPPKYFDELLTAANQRGLNLTKEHLYGLRNTAPS